MASWRVRKIVDLILCGGVLLGAPAARADDAPPSDAPAGDAPADETARLRARLDALEAEVHAKRAEPSAAAEAARDKPPVVVSAFAHVDWTLLSDRSEDEVDSSGKPLNEMRFLLRRGRIRVESDRGYVHGVVMIDANTIDGPQVRPWNVEASLKYPADLPYPGEPVIAAREPRRDAYVVVSAGLLQTPFGFELQEYDITRPWLERSSVVSAFFPSPYDLGLRVIGGYRMVQWELAVVNGDPIGEKTFPGRDPNKSKDLVMRVGTGSDVTEAVRLEAGISALTGRGFHEGTPATKDQIVWRDENENGIVEPQEIQVAAGSPASPSSSFDRFALGADLRAIVRIPVLGSLEARAEIARAKNLDRGLYIADPVAATRDLREIGWYVGVSQEVTRWAAVGVRYDTYDPDADATDLRALGPVPKDPTFSTWSFMATSRPAKAMRVIAEYDLRKNALGRDATGSPTTLADDSFTIRAEVKF